MRALVPEAELEATTDTTPRAERADALAAFAAQAADLGEIKKCVNDAASTSGALWISYLFVLLYTAIAAGAVTPVDLFMQNPVKLPFLSIDLPLKAFFFLAPVLFLVTHVYTLVSFVILSDKAKLYHRELRRQIALAGADDPDRANRIQDDLRRHLVSNIFVQFLAGPFELRHGPFGGVIKLIVWTTLVFAPAGVLLLLQVQFLPYHAPIITATQRIVLLLDLVAVWWLWYRILAGRFTEEQTWRRLFAGTAQGAVVAASVLALAFSWTIATFPGEWQEASLPSLRMMPGGKDGRRLSLHEYLFARPINETTHRREGFFTSTLILPAFSIYEQLKLDGPGDAVSRTPIFNARGRDFRGAVLDLANLSQIDFQGADLEGASLVRVKLRGSSFYCARMRGASLVDAQMQGAWLRAADLEKADLNGAEAQAATFDAAVLRGANLVSARMQAARFDGADLSYAHLASASFRGSTFTAMPASGLTADCVTEERRKAALAGVDFGYADLTDADFGEVTLQDANLAEASLEKTRLANANLSGTLFTHAKLAGDAALPNHGPLVENVWEGRTAAEDLPRAQLGQAHAAPDTTAVKDAMYRQGLADGLSDLVCSGDPAAATIVHGLLDNDRMADAGVQGRTAIDTILGGECGGATAVADKARLVALKRRLAIRDRH